MKKAKSLSLSQINQLLILRNFATLHLKGLAGLQQVKKLQGSGMINWMDPPTTLHVAFKHWHSITNFLKNNSEGTPRWIQRILDQS